MATTMSARQRQFFILALLALLAAGKATDPCLDWDPRWHLHVGQHIVERGQVPYHDPFSQLGREQHVPWIAYSWLFELGLYESYRAGGFDGVLLFRNLLVMMSWGGFAWFFLRHARNRWLGLGLLALATISLRP